jgi:YafQ family addiction module toxin component
MTYTLDISDQLDKQFTKLRKKDKKQLEVIDKKIQEIVKNPYHFKPLRGDMHGARRVHIGKSYVLIFEIDEKQRIIRLLDFNHHDVIY